MQRLMYSSTAVTSLNEIELEALLGSSRRHNADDDLTGLLLHVHAGEPGSAYFVQLLEGPISAVKRTYSRIEQDELHSDLTVLEYTPANRRLFHDWTMHLADISIAQLQPAAAQATTPSAAAARAAEDLIHDPTAMTRLISRYA